MPTLLSPPSPSPRSTRLLVLGLLSLMAILLVASVRQESQTFDEADHLFAGFEYWKHGDFGRNPEHPPLVKFLAAIPLLPMHLQEPPTIPIPFFKAQDFINASQLLYSSNADSILLRGRLVILPFTLALGLLVFFAAREMFNPLAGLIALGLFTFEPVLLANGALVTTDMPLACLFFAAVYTFFRYSTRPSPLRLAICVLASALAIVSKHSGILILPTLALLALVDPFVSPRPAPAPAAVTSPAAAPSPRPLRPQLAGRLALALAVIFTLGYVGIWAVYGFRYAARPGALTMVPTLAQYAAALTHPAQRSIISFLAAHRLLPEAYLYGWVDILLIPGTRSTFLFDRLFPSGQWFFFPAVFLIKSTLALLLLLLLLPFARLRGHRREILFLAVPAAFFLLLAVASMLNLGIRHLLPVYPLCIVLAGAAAASFLTSASPLPRFATAALLLLTAISSLHAFPDFLAYSNEIAGGPSHTYRLLTDSNADWGQGLKWTRTYLDQHPDPGCWMAYTNPVVPTGFYGIHCKPLISGLGRFFGAGFVPVPPTVSGTFLISSTELDGLTWGPDSLNPYAPFRNRPPDARIGNIILVYHGTFDVPLLSAETNAAAATTLLRQRQVAPALALAQTAAQQAPDAADIQATLAEVLFVSGHPAEARQAFIKAVHLAETVHPDFQKQLIDALRQAH